MTRSPRLVILFVIHLWLVGSLGDLCAQSYNYSSSINREIAKKGIELVNAHLPNIPVELEMPDMVYLQSAFEIFLDESFYTPDSLQLQLFDAKINVEKKKIGLRFSAVANQNNQNFNVEEFEENARFRAGLDWDLLQNGLLERKKNIQDLNNQKELFRLEQSLQRKIDNYPYLYNCLIYAFNQEKQQLLLGRQMLLTKHIDLLYELYFSHEMIYTNIIEEKSKLEESNVLLAACESYNQVLETELGKENLPDLDAAKLPPVDVDLESLLGQNEITSYQERMRALKAEQIDINYKKDNETQLKLYGYLNQGNIGNNFTNSRFTSLGIRFKTPVLFNKKNKAKAAALEKQLIDDDLFNERFNNRKELINLYGEFQYKLKQYSNFTHKVFTIRERIRMEKVLLADAKTTHTPFKLLGLIDNFWAVEYELLEIKQQMYLILLKMQLRSHQEFFTSCLKPVNYQAKEKKLVGNRYLILNPAKIKDLDKNFILKYLKKNEIVHILLEDQQYQDVAWLKYLDQEGFNIYGNYQAEAKMQDVVRSLMDGFFSLSGGTENVSLFIRDLSGAISPAAIPLTRVPDHAFENRNELERWINYEKQLVNKNLFLFEDIRQLMALDKKNLGVGNYEKL